MEILLKYGIFINKDNEKNNHRLHPNLYRRNRRPS